MSVSFGFYLDTNALVYATEETSERSTLLGELFSRSAQADRPVLFTSELSLGERIVRPLRDRNQQLVGRYEAMIQTSAWLGVHPVSRRIIELAGTLRAHASVKLPDAIHLATALAIGCTHFFLTGDKALHNLARGAPLRINAPGAVPLSMAPLDGPTLTTLLESLSP